MEEKTVSMEGPNTRVGKEMTSPSPHIRAKKTRSESLIIRQLASRTFGRLGTYEGTFKPTDPYEFWTRVSKHCGLRLYAENKIKVNSQTDLQSALLISQIQLVSYMLPFHAHLSS